jgi:hypothetical protein
MLLTATFPIAKFENMYKDENSLLEAIFEHGVIAKYLDRTSSIHPDDILVEKLVGLQSYTSVPNHCVQITIVFNKELNDIYIERYSEEDRLDWMNEEQESIFRSFLERSFDHPYTDVESVSLADLKAEEANINHLIGFAVREILPSEIVEVKYELVINDKEVKTLITYSDITSINT